MSNLSPEQTHTSSLGQNARVSVLALTYNGNSAIDLHNQRDNYLSDLDWDRPPPIHHFIMPHETANWLYPISSHPHHSKTSSFIPQTDCSQSDTKLYLIS